MDENLNTKRRLWQEEAARLKVYEERSEAAYRRNKKAFIVSLVAVLLCITVFTSVYLVRFSRYNRAAEYLTAGQYELAAEEFVQMADFRDSRSKVYEAALGMFRNRQYKEALPYFIWLGEDVDGGYYIRKCREYLGTDPQSSVPVSVRLRGIDIYLE